MILIGAQINDVTEPVWVPAPANQKYIGDVFREEGNITPFNVWI